VKLRCTHLCSDAGEGGLSAELLSFEVGRDPLGLAICHSRELGGGRLDLERLFVRLGRHLEQPLHTVDLLGVQVGLEPHRPRLRLRLQLERGRFDLG
jgi:hypothetical protein